MKLNAVVSVEDLYIYSRDFRVCQNIALLYNPKRTTTSKRTTTIFDVDLYTRKQINHSSRQKIRSFTLRKSYL